MHLQAACSAYRPKRVTSLTEYGVLRGHYVATRRYTLFRNSKLGKMSKLWIRISSRRGTGTIGHIGVPECRVWKVKSGRNMDSSHPLSLLQISPWWLTRVLVCSDVILSLGSYLCASHLSFIFLDASFSLLTLKVCFRFMLLHFTFPIVLRPLKKPNTEHIAKTCFVYPLPVRVPLASSWRLWAIRDSRTAKQ